MTKTITKGLMTLALVAATAACDGAPTASSALAAQTDGPALVQAQAKSRLTFTSTQNYQQATPQTATGSARSIDFTGSLTTSNPCYDVTASHSTSSNEVTLTVSAVSTGGFCAQVMTYNNYEGAISGLQSGTYDFTVVHDVNGSQTVAYQDTVVVL